jgi:hypothetical protein
MKLWVASAGLEIVCIHAWAAFSLVLIQEGAYPAWLAAGTFALGSWLAATMRRSERQGAERALLYAVSLLVLAPLAVHWVVGAAVLEGARPLRTYLAVAAALLWTGVLWFAGARHGRTPMSYASVCGRFDRAVGWLAELFLVKILLRTQPDLKLEDTGSAPLVIAFFLFALVALASARSLGGAKKSSVGGFRGLAPAMGIGSGVVLCVAASSLLFLPQLKAAAQAGFAVVSQVGGPLGAAFAYAWHLFYLLWLFLAGPARADRPDRRERTSTVDRVKTWDEVPFELPDDAFWLPWVAGGVVALLVVSFIAWVVWRRPRGIRTSLSFRRLQRLWYALLQLFATHHGPEAVRLYVALTHWGRRSGMVARAFETPLEYSARLQAALPAMAPEISLIVDAFNRQLYAPRSQPLAALHAERAALRRLRGVRLWPRRFKLWLTAGAEPPARGLHELVVSTRSDGE